MARTIVHLVHGTWPYGFLAHHITRCRRPESTWFHKNSAFCQALTTALPGADVIPFEWSGDNSYLARHHAASCLAFRMMQCHDPNDPPRQIIVAHSHGGSVAHIASRHPWAPALSGIVAMATPFLQIERRTPDAHQESLLAYLQTATLLLLGSCITIILFAWFDVLHVFSSADTTRSTSWPFTDLSWFGSSALIVVLLLVAGMLQRVGPMRNAIKETQGWPAHPRAQWFVVRTDGDEASRWLARARKAYTLFDFTWRRVRAVLAAIAPALKYRWPMLLLLAPAPWVRPSLTTLARRFLLDEPWHVAWRSVVPETGWLAAGAPIVLPVLAVLVIVGALLFVAGGLISPFGWEFYVMGLAFEIRAGETPPHSPYAVSKVPYTWMGRRHSVYESPQARTRIADWIAQQPTADPTSRPWRIITR